MSKRNILILSLSIVVGAAGLLITTTRAAGDLTPKEARRLLAELEIQFREPSAGVRRGD